MDTFRVPCGGPRGDHEGQWPEEGAWELHTCCSTAGPGGPPPARCASLLRAHSLTKGGQSAGAESTRGSAAGWIRVRSRVPGSGTARLPVGSATAFSLFGFTSACEVHRNPKCPGSSGREPRALPTRLRQHSAREDGKWPGDSTRKQPAHLCAEKHGSPREGVPS